MTRTSDILGVAMVLFFLIIGLMMVFAFGEKIDKPSAGTEEYAAYTNFTKIFQITGVGLYGVMLILLMIIVVSAVALMGRRRW